jgi:hypothetical protein
VLDSRPATDAGAARPGTSPGRALLADALAVLGVLLLLGVVGGVLWPQLVDAVVFTRTSTGITSDETALAHQFDADGWYIVLAAVGGAAAGAGLALWRDRDPVVTVLLLLLGAGLAALVMRELGTTLGPPPVQPVLRGAHVGATAPAPLDVHARAAYVTWPVATLLAAALVFWTRGLSHVKVR